MGKYICPGCNYRFSSEDPIKCPSCGIRIEEFIDDEQSATDILDEIEKLLRE